ncbi:glycine-rich domain-containing protein [Allosphingosinicella deserti]|nr:hypothetical protein [Sphingomonas deserti]
MTGDLRAAADPTGLWPTLSDFRIGSSPSQFERRLADANGWPDAHAARVIAEYRRFLYLAAIADFEVTPSKPVDAAWHLHLEDDDHYRGVLCGQVLGKLLQHLPGSGEPLEEERFRAQYRETLRLYESIFGPAPSDIWPIPSIEDDRTEAESIRLWLGALCAALAGTFLALLAGPTFLFIGGIVAVSLAVLAMQRTEHGEQRRRNKDGSGCGGDASVGHDSSGGDGDCASCGGGCGGGD